MFCYTTSCSSKHQVAFGSPQEVSRTIDENPKKAITEAEQRRAEQWVEKKEKSKFNKKVTVNTDDEEMEKVEIGKSASQFLVGSISVLFVYSNVITLPAEFMQQDETNKSGEVPEKYSNTSYSSISIQVTKPHEPKRVVFEKPGEEMTKHIRPLYIRANMNRRPVSHVLINNGSVVNIMPSKMFHVLGRTEDDLISTDVSVSAFNGKVSRTLGILPVKLTVGTNTTLAAFFVINSTANYHALLGRDWIHANWCVLSSLHQLLLFWKGDDVEVVWADSQPF